MRGTHRRLVVGGALLIFHPKIWVVLDLDGFCHKNTAFPVRGNMYNKHVRRGVMSMSIDVGIQCAQKVTVH